MISKEGSSSSRSSLWLKILIVSLFLFKPGAASCESVCTKENGHFPSNLAALGLNPNIHKEPCTAGLPSQPVNLQKLLRAEVPGVNINRLQLVL